jgi:DNA primase
VNNRVIGFGGRVMGAGEPKYLNSPETKLFDKSRNLYGLNYARLSREKYILICEGYMDVIAMHQAGFTNAVASLGTAFTTQHAALLKRYTDKVVLTYDSDGAGTKAALRAIPILRDVGMSIRVLNMQPHKDPDEFIKNMGAEAFRERIEQARNSFLFEIDVLKRNYEMDDPEQKTGFYNQVAKKLCEFPEALERENYLEAVSREFFINYEDLKRLVNRMGARLGPVAPREEEENTAGKKKKDREDGRNQSQRLLLTWLIENPFLFDKIEGIITPDDFIEDLYHQVAKMVFDGHAAGNLNPAEILNHFINDEEQYRVVAGLFNASLKESLDNEEQKKAFSETIMKVKKNSLDYASRNAAGIEELQRIIKEQAALKDLHISLD